MENANWMEPPSPLLPSCFSTQNIPQAPFVARPSSATSPTKNAPINLFEPQSLPVPKTPTDNSAAPSALAISPHPAPPKLIPSPPVFVPPVPPPRKAASKAKAQEKAQQPKTKEDTAAVYQMCETCGKRRRGKGAMQWTGCVSCGRSFHMPCHSIAQTGSEHEVLDWQCPDCRKGVPPPSLLKAPALQRRKKEQTSSSSSAPSTARKRRVIEDSPDEAEDDEEEEDYEEEAEVPVEPKEEDEEQEEEKAEKDYQPPKRIESVPKYKRYPPSSLIFANKSSLPKAIIAKSPAPPTPTTSDQQKDKVAEEDKAKSPVPLQANKRQPSRKRSKPALPVATQRTQGVQEAGAVEQKEEEVRRQPSTPKALPTEPPVSPLPPSSSPPAPIASPVTTASPLRSSPSPAVPKRAPGKPRAPAKKPPAAQDASSSSTAPRVVTAANLPSVALWFDATVSAEDVAKALSSRPERFVAFGQPDSVPLHIAGEVPGVPPGTVFMSRHDLKAAGVHAMSDGGVHSAQGQVYSLLADGFNAGTDSGNEIAYEFIGKRTEKGVVNANHQIEPGVDNARDLALIHSWLQHKPIRFVRGKKCELGPKNGAYRYEGLFQPCGIEQREVKGEGGKMFLRYFLILRRLQTAQGSDEDAPPTEPPVWKFQAPSYFWHGQICPNCMVFVPAAAQSKHQLCKTALPIGYGNLEEVYQMDGDTELILLQKFIDHATSSRYLKSLLNDTQWVYHVYNGQFPEKKLTSFYGDEGVSYGYGGHRRHATGWHPALVELRNFLIAQFAHSPFDFLRNWRPNCALLNLYPQGHNAMKYHQDNEAELGPDPVVVSVSFGEARVFQIRAHCPKGTRRKQQIDAKRKGLKLSLGHGSVLIMGKNVQTLYEHSLLETKELVGPRVNITFRVVQPKGSTW